MNYRHLVIFSLLFLSVLSINAQSNLKLQRSLNWDVNLPLKDGEKSGALRLYFEGAQVDGPESTLPYFSERIAINSGAELVINITSAQWETFTPPIPLDDDALTGSGIPRYVTGTEKKQEFAMIYFIPIRKNSFTGEYERLSSFELNVQQSATNKTSGNSRSASSWSNSSVLANGSWYQIRVSNAGIHKVDYELLQELGMPVDQINPANLRIYGNGGGMLPELNGAARHDDLVENPIYIVGGNDGSFDPGDYVLFYTAGPDVWEWTDGSSRYEHVKHLYSDHYNYFITADLGPGKRISSIGQAGTSNRTSTAYDFLAFHEVEDVNLIRSGRQWFGDYFNFSVTQRNFPFTIPNVISSTPVFVRTKLAGRSPSASSSASVSANGQLLYTHSISKVPSGSYPPYADITELDATVTSGSSLTISVAFAPATTSAEAWLDYIEVQARAEIKYAGSPLYFRDKNSIGTGNITEFKVSNASGNLLVWDVTDPVNPFNQNTNFSASQISFNAATDSLREFAVFNPSGSFPEPEAVGSVANQDLHGMGQPDMVIITTNELMSTVGKLRDFHSGRGLEVALVDISKIYNEFSSGTQDITAIRDMMRMLYEKAGTDTSKMPKYLLLFGDGSYDNRDHLNKDYNLIPTYQSRSSIDPLTTYCTDDYYGCLDPNEGSSLVDGSNPNLLDVAIGRIPVDNVSDANAFIEKIKNYYQPSSFGTWRNTVVFVGDDEDNNIHINDAESLANTVRNINRAFVIDKIYMDAYPQESTPGGSRYPDVKSAINNRIFQGCLLLNYIGHGGVNGWAQERVLDINDISSWENYDKLPAFLTATCQFSRYDDHALVSAGEKVIIHPNNAGAIALLTTVRLVFSNDNYALSREYLTNAFTPVNGKMLDLGESILVTKNNALNVTSDLNTRKFTLLGDPAVKLAFPKYDIVTTSISDGNTGNSIDTISALQKVTVSGEVQLNGQKLSGFNGTVYPTVFDKDQEVTTLVNDPQSNKKTFSIQKNAIYKGKASVVDGSFRFTFIVPKDINYSIGAGSINYYANTNQEDANGNDSDFTIGGTATGYEEDDTGPEVEIYMNDESFVFGGMTDEDPVLLLKVFDENGINTVGTGIGHDLTAVLDEDTRNTYVLNDYYEGELDDYQRGEVRYPFSSLEDGLHQVTAKVWDVYNNSSEAYTEFFVTGSEDLALDHVLNYPNPFTTSTNFQFEHNRPGDVLFVQVQIFTVSGKLVKSIQTEVFTEGYRVDNVFWDGLDDYGDKIGRGVYVYKVRVRDSNGNTASQFEKLVILR